MVIILSLVFAWQNGPVFLLTYGMHRVNTKPYRISLSPSKLTSSLSALDLLLCVVTQGLDHLHCRQLGHFDIKPSNVFLASDGACKLGDFGLCVSLDQVLHPIYSMSLWTRYSTLYIACLSGPGTPPYL